MRRGTVLGWAAVAAGVLALPAGLRAGEGGEAKKLFDAMEKKLLEAKTVELTLDASFKAPKGKGGMKATLAMAQGNKLKVDMKFTLGEKESEVLVVSDGTKVSQGMKGKGTEEKETKKHQNEDLIAYVARIGLLPAFMQAKKQGDESRPKDTMAVSGFKLGKKEEIGGRQAQAVEYEVAIEGAKQKLNATVWLDAETGLPVRRTISGPVDITETYTIRVNGEIPGDRFALPKEKGE